MTVKVVTVYMCDVCPTEQTHRGCEPIEGWTFGINQYKGLHMCPACSWRYHGDINTIKREF
jgi:hypothetical protein